MKVSKRTGIAIVAVASFMTGAVVVGRIVAAQTGGSNPVTGAIAQPPRLLAYSGFLESNGQTVDQTNVPMKFFITANASDAIGSALWISGASTIPIDVNDGHFSVVLGDTAAGQNAFPTNPTDLFGRDSLFLRIEVGGQTLSGGQRLVATPYAITAETPTTFRVGTIQASHFAGPFVTGDVYASVTGSGGSDVKTIYDAAAGVTAFCAVTWTNFTGNDTDIIGGAGCYVGSTSPSPGVTRWGLTAVLSYGSANGNNSVSCKARCLVIP